MDKIAYYETLIMEKAAAGAIRKNWGSLSPESQEKLRQHESWRWGGTERFREGLERGSQAVAKKHNVQILPMDDNNGFGLHQPILGRAKIYRGRQGAEKFYSGLAPSEKSELDALYTSHEAVRELPRLKNVAYKENGKGRGLYSYGSHMSPSVIYGESSDAAMASPKVRDAMAAARMDKKLSSAGPVQNTVIGARGPKGLSRISQAEDMAHHGEPYGKSGVYNKSLAKKHDREFLNIVNNNDDPVKAYKPPSSGQNIFSKLKTRIPNVGFLDKLKKIRK